MPIIDILCGDASLVSPEAVATEALEYLGVDHTPANERSIVDVICGPVGKNGVEAIATEIARLTFDD